MTILSPELAFVRMLIKSSNEGNVEMRRVSGELDNSTLTLIVFFRIEVLAPLLAYI